MKGKEFFRKAHKWVGLSLSVLVVLFALSGIVLNHRSFFASVEVNRAYLPKAYQYTNWNNASVRATLKLSDNNILIYGNIGVWKTDSTFQTFRNLNDGFGVGIDSRKIAKVLPTNRGLLAGTLFGLYKYSEEKARWIKLTLPVKEENVVDLLQKGDSIYVLTRSNLLITTDLNRFTLQELPKPEGYDNKVGLFKTLWVLHSGEIYGHLGKVVVDVAALILIVLCIGGIVLFFSKKGLKRPAISKLKRDKLKKRFKWNLTLHNRLGWITGIFLLFTALTGMFLRPPLLVAIGNARVNKIPFTELDTPNPWYDLLRRIVYIPDSDSFLISTSEGFYAFDALFSTEAKRFDPQPPASIMGVTVLELLGENTLMVGSFEGLFSWNYSTGQVYDLIKQKPYVRPLKMGPPVGDFKVSGFSLNYPKQPVVFDYDRGALFAGVYALKTVSNVSGISDNVLTSSVMDGVEMPKIVLDNSPMSLWSLALEVHTGRIYSALLGPLYILVVPLGGLLILFTLISGLVVWFKRKR